MASSVSGRCLRASILHLPPAVRTSLYANTRSFSSTPQRKVDAGSTLTSIAVAVPTAVLDGVHSIGLPWCAAIPVTAILVRGVFGYYVAAKPARKRALAHLNLAPLINARAKDDIQQWGGRREQAYDQCTLKRPPEGARKLQLMAMAMWYRLKGGYQLGKAYGAPMFTWQNGINFATLIAFTEAVRIKCGTKEGLLTLLLAPLQWLQDDAPRPPVDPAEALAERLAAVRESKQQQLLSSDALPDGNALANEYQLPRLNTSAYLDFADPTMKVEGFSWLQDLTVPDTTLILPITLGCIMAANALLRPSVKKQPDTVKDIQEKLKAFDESNDITPENKTSTSKSAPHRDTPKTSSVTNDVLHALEVAEKLNAEIAAKKNKPDRFFVNLSTGKRLSLIFALTFTAIALQMPAALVLYLFGTLATAWLQGRFLDVKYPMRQVIAPCKRQMRYKIKREYSDV